MFHQCNVGQSYPRIPALNMAPRAIDSPLCRLAGCAVSSLMQHGFRAKLTTVSIMRSTHLINAGKYSAGILYFFIYFNWRITSQSAYDFRFAMFIVFAVINSTYSLIWDLLMDWGLLRRKSKNFLLRDELAWRRTKWVRLARVLHESLADPVSQLYYVAIVVDICLRFTWVAYIPTEGSVRLRGFIIAVVETLRRWMWNVSISDDVRAQLTIPQSVHSCRI